MFLCAFKEYHENSVDCNEPFSIALIAVFFFVLYFNLASEKKPFLLTNKLQIQRL